MFDECCFCCFFVKDFLVTVELLLGLGLEVFEGPKNGKSYIDLQFANEQLWHFWSGLYELYCTCASSIF